MNRNIFLSAVLPGIFAIGFLLTVSSSPVITGAAIGIGKDSIVTPMLGLLFMVSSGIMLAAGDSLDKKLEKIGKYYYEPHAIDRMKERNLFPSVVEDAIKHGEHYKLKHVKKTNETNGATDAYVKRNSAQMLGGQIGQRIIKIDPGQKVKENNILILVGPDNKAIKTVLTPSKKKLKAFLEKYTD